jgi:C4-dicarboxylate transporter DctM subunit
VEIIIMMFVLFFLLAFMNVPIAFTLGFAAIVPLLITEEFPLVSVTMAMTQSIDSFPFMAIPFFILAGNLMDKGGISERLVRFANSMVGSVHGGLAIVTVVACTFFGAISGSGPATVAAIGGIMVPYMIKEGYGAGFAAAIAASAGCLGLFIPPSIAMITYGVTTGQSIGALFIGGVGPGLITAFGLCLVSYVISKKRGYKGNMPFSMKNVKATGKNAMYPLLMPVIILGGIYGGIFTPTEAAAVAVFYAVIVGFFFTRELKLGDLPQILTGSAVTTAMVMLIIATASAFGRLLTLLELPAALVNLVIENNVSAMMFLLVINIVMLIAGTFMELNATILILAPILLPISKTLGIDPVHLGIIMVVNMTFGLLTPPLGVHLFVACGIAKIKFDVICREILPFLLLAVVVIFIVTYIPQTGMWLVKLFY